jgi:hypothetical protein
VQKPEPKIVTAPLPPALPAGDAEKPEHKAVCHPDVEIRAPLEVGKSGMPAGDNPQRDASAQSPAFPCVINVRHIDCARRSFCASPGAS